LRCLSRMRGNSHVRFLGGKGAEKPLTYPINAFLFVHEEKRRNRNTTLRHTPIPFPESIDSERITYLVEYYIELRLGFTEDPSKKFSLQEYLQTLMEIDSLILKAYDLPPRLERKLLDLFRGQPRPVPFDFPDYFPDDFGPCIPLHKYIEMNLEQASAGELLKKITPLDSKDMHEFFMDIEARQS